MAKHAVPRSQAARRSSRIARATIAYVIEPLERRVQLSASLSLIGTQTITPGAVVNASNDGSTWQSEMSAVVNPTDPLNVVGFTHHITSGLGFPQLDVLWSKQGGKAGSWTTNVIDGADDGFPAGTLRADPTMAFDDDGRLFIGYLAFVSEGGSFTVKLEVARSLDGGETFGQFTTIDSAAPPPTPAPLDKPFMAVGRDPVSGDSAVYIAYNLNVGGAKIVVRGTRDGGVTYFPPVSPVIEPPVTVGTSGSVPIFACPAVGPNGELYVSWYDADITALGTDKIYFDRDLDGLWGTNYSFDSTGDANVRTLANGSLYKYRRPPAAPDHGVHTAPILTVDRSGGTYNGRLYLSFIELNAPDPSQDTNVVFGYGTLNVQTQTVSWTFLDTPQTLVDSSTGTEFHPWVDVDQATGSVNLLYYTTDGDQGQTQGNDDAKMRLAVSLNGGVAWTRANATTDTTEEAGDHPNDYLEYIGFDVHQGTAHGLFAFDPSPLSTDLDAMHVDAAFVSAENTLTIDGTSGNDTIALQISSANSSYLEVVVNGVKEFVGRFATVGNAVVNLGAGDDIIHVYDDFPFSLTINGGAGSDSIIVEGGSATNEIALDAGLEMEFLLVNDDDQGEARVVLTDSQFFGQLTIGTGGGVRIVPNGNLFVRAEAITISSGGFFDLADNDMIVDGVAYEFIEPLLISGYNGGQWNGSGIRSSLANASTRALGIALASDLGVSTFAGQSVASNAVLIKYTFYGDADLSGHVNLADFNRLASNFGQSSRRWVHGDFNFNGVVNLADFNLLASNFGSTDGPEVGEYYTYEELEKMLEEYGG